MNLWYYIMIAAAVVLIVLVGPVVLEIYKDTKSYNKIIEKIGDIERGTLSGQHEMLEKVINDNHNSIKEFIKAGNEQLVKNADFTINKIQKISDELISEEAEQKYQYENIHEHQKKIDHHITEIEDLIREWKCIVTENTEFKEENERLKNKYYELLNENKKLMKSLHIEQEGDISL